MKVIFLDIDGVLNCTGDFESITGNYMNPVLIRRLVEIINETESKIVLSSSWRINEKDKEQASLALSYFGLEIFDQTPVVCISKRGEEISKWLDGSPVERFVILDDDSRAGIESNVGVFLQTNPDEGLDQRTVGKAIKYLNS